MEGTSVDASVVDLAKPMPEPDHTDMPEDDDDADDTYTGDGVVAPANSDGQDDDSFFFIGLLSDQVGAWLSQQEVFFRTRIIDLD